MEELELPVELIKQLITRSSPTGGNGEEEAKRMALEKALAGIREELPEGIKIVDRFSQLIPGKGDGESESGGRDTGRNRGL